MSAQDKTEEILRQMHILLAGSEAYDSIGSRSSCYEPSEKWCISIQPL